jgi:TonB-dependent starch-binding outer membrane protein SusC
MNLKLLAKRLTGALLLLAMPFLVSAQQKTVNGKITSDKDGSPISGATVLAKGSTKGTKTAADGSFVLEVPAATTKLVISSVGFGTQELTIGADNTANLVLAASNEALTEVVVIGYGTARKRDVTGSVGSVAAKNFNKGPLSSPDQLIQGKVAGVQVITNNGAPGAGTTIRIRGANSIRAGNTPLFVIDGVPLSNTNSRPDIDLTGDIGGSTSSGNPLNFINPNDIATMDVLKDASAAAIYGSRGSNGVVLITTKKGQAGVPKVDFNMSLGTSKIAKKIRVLTGDEYRGALTKLNVPAAAGNANTDAIDAITRNGSSQNYGLSVSAGNESLKYRFSLGYLDQKGIVNKTDFKKYNAAFYSNLRMLNSKKLGIDFSVSTTQTAENMAPISNKGGAKGSLIGQALKWNPTKSLYAPNGTDLFIDYGSDEINPLAYSTAYFDNAKVTTVLASVAPSYKLTKDLEVKSQMSINYSVGSRRQYTDAKININNIAVDRSITNTSDPNFNRGGDANLAQNQLVTKQITNTIAYNKDISKRIYLNAVLGHEYIKTDNLGNSTNTRSFDIGVVSDKPYYNFMANSLTGNRVIKSFQDPTTELQSFFGRTIFNISEKYLITATFRADGSSKFGKNNRYGYFPSVAAAWNLSKENFMKNLSSISNIKLRVSYGITGNQEYPAGVSQQLYDLNTNNPASIQPKYIENPDLTWEETKTFNTGLDFSLLSNKINVTVEYFNKNTSKLLFPVFPGAPAAAGAAQWKNIDGNVINSGVEFSVNVLAVQKNDFSLNVSANATFIKNVLKNYVGEILTGEINGPGLSGTPTAQIIKTDYPLNSYYLKPFVGINKTTKLSDYEFGEKAVIRESANPTTLLGFSLNAAYKKITLEMNFNGAFGHYIYNNSENAYLGLNGIGRLNITKKTLDYAIANGESTTNPTQVSTRYLEKGDYLRLANMTVGYNFGALGKSIRSLNVFLTGQNLFLITKFSGFDPEVNVDKTLNEVPSFGMEYTPYPSARSFNFGVNVSF